MVERDREPWDQRRPPLDTTGEVETPEHVRFRFNVAGPMRRAAAYLLDLMLRGLIVILLLGLLAIAGIDGGAIVKGSTGVMLVVLFALEWGYYIFFDVVMNGASPGKRALRLRVVTERGYPLGLYDSVLRNLLRAADFLPFGYAIGALVSATDGRFRRLGDLVAGTIVIVEERREVASGLRIDPLPTDKELARLPQRVPLSGDELEAVELFLRRTNRLSAARREELAEMVAPIFARRMGMKARDPVRLLELIHCRAHPAHTTSAEPDRADRARSKARGA